ncbi:MAG: restriction endonuclease [Phycisphaerales bacterium]|nr:restriction endonuclease [Phycisphaerales bacterium]
MAIPTSKACIEPLLAELLKAGGSSSPGDMYTRVAARFPDLTKDDLERELNSGNNMFQNRVQWARQRLVEMGLIDPSIRGVWKLTDEGIAAANGVHEVSVGHRTAAPTSLIELIGQHDDELRSLLHAALQSLRPDHFEQLSGRLLRAMGFRDVEVTQRSADGGVDGHGRLKLGIVSVNAAFQCKRWQKAIGRPDVDTFRGATQGKYDQAIFITTSRFTDGAIAESIRPGCIPVVMLDGDGVIDLMIQHGIGVSTKPLVIPQFDEEYFAGFDEDGG